jgi:hypothetical protein
MPPLSEGSVPLGVAGLLAFMVSLSYPSRAPPAPRANRHVDKENRQ